LLLTFCKQENAKACTEAKNLPIPQPYILVRGCLAIPKDAYLIVERKMFKIENDEIPLVLLAAFYTFDIHFTVGLSNVYIFLDNQFLGTKLPKEKTRLHNFKAKLSKVIM